MQRAERFRGVPELIYGTAFKFDETAVLVEAAIQAGFRAVDTSANKPQYRESLVAEGIAATINNGLVTRSELYVRITSRHLFPVLRILAKPSIAHDRFKPSSHHIKKVETQRRIRTTRRPASRNTSDSRYLRRCPTYALAI